MLRSRNASQNPSTPYFYFPDNAAPRANIYERLAPVPKLSFKILIRFHRNNFSWIYLLIVCSKPEWIRMRRKTKMNLSIEQSRIVASLVHFFFWRNYFAYYFPLSCAMLLVVHSSFLPVSMDRATATTTTGRGEKKLCFVLFMAVVVSFFRRSETRNEWREETDKTMS